jgi:hypothetical protein
MTAPQVLDDGSRRHLAGVPPPEHRVDFELFLMIGARRTGLEVNNDRPIFRSMN